MLRVLHVVAGLERSQGGLAYSVPRLCRALADAGLEVELYAIARQTMPVQDITVEGFTAQTFRWNGAGLPLLSGFRLSAAFSTALEHTASRVDVVHVHGLWNWPSLIACRAATAAGIPLVFSPRGMLSPGALQISTLKKRMFWSFAQKSALDGVSCFHVTGDLEADELRISWAGQSARAPIAVIPNGIDFSPLPVRRPRDGRHRVLSLGRIHPKKGLDLLLKAWATVERLHADWSLHIVGPSELGHDRELERLAQQLGLERVFVQGPLYGDDKAQVYRDADVFVLPSRAENFALTVAEALASELPVIATRNTPWAGLEPNGCGWFVAATPEAIGEALKAAMALSDTERLAMGQRGRGYAEAAFQWDAVGRSHRGVYRWLRDGTDRPTTIHAF